MTPSEIARKIAEKLCIDDMIRAHHRKAVAAIIEPEVRELVAAATSVSNAPDEPIGLPEVMERIERLRAALTQPKEHDHES